MVQSFPRVVAYIQRKKDGPFTLGLYSHRRADPKSHWIIDCCDSVVYPCSFNGNSKQRRQQRRKLLKELNQ